MSTTNLNDGSLRSHPAKLTPEQKRARQEAERAYELRIKRARLPKDHEKYLPYSVAIKRATKAYDAAKNAY